jgi:hypothetical protein
MKKIFFVLILSFQLFGQDSNYDTTAIQILDKMADIIGNLASCSYNLNTSYDVIDVELGTIKHFDNHKVYMVGPDKMLVDSRGDKGHRGYWYNGKQLAYYSYTQNNFAVIDAPSTIIAAIDTVNKVYGIDFPAADLFYPTFTDDLINNYDEIILAGTSEVSNKNCFHIIAKNSQMSIQLWISNDALFLPERMVIVYYDVNPNTQYDATFTGWKINPQLPDAMFDFSPPAGANELTLVAKKK